MDAKSIVTYVTSGSNLKTALAITLSAAVLLGVTIVPIVTSDVILTSEGVSKAHHDKTSKLRKLAIIIAIAIGIVTIGCAAFIGYTLSTLQNRPPGSSQSIEDVQGSYKYMFAALLIFLTIFVFNSINLWKMIDGGEVNMDEKNYYKILSYMSIFAGTVAIVVVLERFREVSQTVKSMRKLQKLQNMVTTLSSTREEQSNDIII